MQKMSEVVCRVRNAHDRASVAELDCILGIGLRKGEKPTEYLGVAGEQAAMNAEGGVLGYDNDVAVLQPQVRVFCWIMRLC